MILLVAAGAGDARPQASGAVSYAEVAPVLAERCVLCHAGEPAPAGLRLDSFEGVQKGSHKGPVVKAGDRAASALIRRVKGTTLPRMPMTGPPFLAQTAIATLERWVAGGLQPGEPASTPSVARAGPPRPATGEPITDAHVAPSSPHVARSATPTRA